MATDPKPAAPFTQLFGVWCKHPADIGWLREYTSGDEGIIAFASAQKARERARRLYGSFATYTAAKRAGWVEVRPLTGGAK